MEQPMTNPTGGQVALTHAEMLALAKTADDVVATSRGIAKSLENRLMTELMPQFKGDAAAASLSLSTTIDQRFNKILQDMQQMSDTVKGTNAAHQQNDASHVAGYNSLANVLNA